MTSAHLLDPELENALLALQAATGRSREELLRDMILKELHLSPLSEENTPQKKVRTFPHPAGLT
jgi:hypothetical protein